MMDRALWKSIEGFLAFKNFPILPCPYCFEVSLGIERETFSYALGSAPLAEKEIKRLEEKEIKQARELVPVKNNPSEVTLGDIVLGVLAAFALASQNLVKGVNKPAKFISFLKCSQCEGRVSATGTAIINRTLVEEAASSVEPLEEALKDDLDKSAIKFEYFSPPLPIFRLSEHVPQAVKVEMLQAFNHIHADPSSSGSKLRRALEKLCIELGVGGKTLHVSIQKLEELHPREAKLFMTLKFLGNEAAHADSVEYSDLLDAFEVQKFALKIFDRLYEEGLLDEKAKRLQKKFQKKI